MSKVVRVGKLILGCNKAGSAANAINAQGSAANAIKTQTSAARFIPIQSMTNTDTSNLDATRAQTESLINIGCDIVRIAVSNEQEVRNIAAIAAEVSCPIVADIQFDYKLAVLSADLGVHKIRFNPGNIGSEDRVKEVVAACKRNNCPIRVGVNSGSIDKDIYAKYGNSAEALVESALKHVGLLEKHGFFDIVVSVKSSNLPLNVAAYRLLAARTDYPLHIGVTESGAYERGIIKSSIGIGALLLDGIGDTLRVSLSGDPLQEVIVAKQILQAVGLDKNYCEIVACPTCSRCKYDLMSVVDRVNSITENIRLPLKIAVMGCVVNGLGEGKDCDYGIAGGGDNAIVFAKGDKLATLPLNEAIALLEKLIRDEITSRQ